MANSGNPKPPAAHVITAFDTHSDPIAIALKRLHAEVEAEEIPAEFLDLLAAIDRKMDAKEKSKK